MLSALLLAATLTTGISIEVADHQVFVRGVTPGATVALYGAGWGLGIVSPFRFDDYRYGVDEDFDGLVRLIPPTGHGYDTTVSHAVWVAVEMESGRLGETALTLPQIGRPTWTTFSLQRTDFAVGAAGAGTVKLTCPGSPVGSPWFVAVVRPRVGLWHGILPDTMGPGVVVQPASLTPFLPDQVPPLATLTPGDVLVGVNPDVSCYAVTTLTPELVVQPRLRSYLPRH